MKIYEGNLITPIEDYQGKWALSPCGNVVKTDFYGQEGWFIVEPFDQATLKYINGELKAKNIVGIDPTVHQVNANFLDGLAGSAYAKTLGNPSNAFQVANAVNLNEAVNLGQFGNVSTQNGYTKFPNGLILQWGFKYNATALTSSQTIMFPIAFPNACLNVVNQPAYGGSWDTFYQNIASANNSGYTRSYTISRWWQAIGYK